MVAAAALLLAGCGSVVTGAGSVGPNQSASSSAPPGPSNGPSNGPPVGTSAPSTPAGSAASSLIRYHGDRFSILLPGAPVKTNVPVKTRVGTITAHVLSVELSLSEAYVITYADYPASVLFSLEGAVRGEAIKTGGQVLGLRRIVYAGQPGRDFRIRIPGGVTAFVRMVVTGHRLYQVQLAERTAATTPPAQYFTVRDSLRF